MGPQPEHKGDAAKDQTNDHRSHNGSRLNSGQRRAERHIDRFTKPFGGTFFSAKGLNRVEGIETFARKAHGVRKPVLSGDGQHSDPAPEKKQGYKDDRYQKHDKTRQLGTDDEQQAKAPDQTQQIAQGDRGG